MSNTPVTSKPLGLTLAADTPSEAKDPVTREFLELLSNVAHFVAKEWDTAGAQRPYHIFGEIFATQAEFSELQLEFLYTLFLPAVMRGFTQAALPLTEGNRVLAELQEALAGAVTSAKEDCTQEFSPVYARWRRQVQQQQEILTRKETVMAQLAKLKRSPRASSRAVTEVPSAALLSNYLAGLYENFAADISIVMKNLMAAVAGVGTVTGRLAHALTTESFSAELTKDNVERALTKGFLEYLTLMRAIELLYNSYPAINPPGYLKDYFAASLLGPLIGGAVARVYDEIAAEFPEILPPLTKKPSTTQIYGVWRSFVWPTVASHKATLSSTGETAAPYPPIFNSLPPAQRARLVATITKSTIVGEYRTKILNLLESYTKPAATATTAIKYIEATADFVAQEINERVPLPAKRVIQELTTASKHRMGWLEKKTLASEEPAREQEPDAPNLGPNS